MSSVSDIKLIRTDTLFFFFLMKFIYNRDKGHGG